MTVPLPPQTWTFVVQAAVQPWPYFEEIPHCAWPEADLEYNSSGNAERPWSQDWSYLDVMHWNTSENIFIWNAQAFALPERLSTLQRFQENLLWDDGLSLLSRSRISHPGIWLLESLPDTYCVPGNVIIRSLSSVDAQPIAAVA